MAKITYNTKQKNLIYEILEKNTSCPLSCDGITDMLKNEGTPVGRATVYRFLETLAEKGEIRKLLDSQSKTATFQLIDKSKNCQQHMHLKCIHCGKIFHLECDYMSDVSGHILEHHNFRVDNSKTVILGVCENCAEEV